MLCFFYTSSFPHSYLIDAEIVIQYWDKKEKGERKSIPFKEFLEKAILLTEGYHPRIDNIKAVEVNYF
ncbi:Holliday junction resolvase RecU [Bacillus sp. OV322]|uniref:Holliday junction resolvase RecU n=1 Tax=Bacillus sp. OV322 TaxID=1882764 RepID=UPI0015A6261F|nr:Holliday junction resolvase RecU [Bacillus sp. OV322]